MSATLPPPGTPDVLYLVDLSGYVFRAYHAIRPLSGPLGEPTHATFGTVSMLHKLINERKPVLLAVAMDSSKPSFRVEIDPNYKATRPKPPEDMAVQLKRCREIVTAYGIHIWQTEGVEADDLIASAVRLARLLKLSVVIVSADKDLMQLVGDGVVMWDTMRDKVYGPEEVTEKFGVAPAQVRDLLALMGDSSDNIPGVAGVGQKTAAQLLTEFGSLEQLLLNTDKIQRKKLRETLESQSDGARLSQKLVTLRDDLPIELDRAGLVFDDPDVSTLRRIYTELGFTRFLDMLPRAPAKERHTTYATVLTAEQLQAMAQASRAAGCFAIHVEADHTEAMRAHLIGLAISHCAGEAFYIPISHRYLGVPHQLPIQAVIEVLGPLLSDPSIRKLGHNVKFDDAVLRRHGFPPIRGTSADTMIVSYLLDPEANHGLKEVAARELNIKMTTYDEVTEKSRNQQLDFDQVPIDKATGYACADADMALQLADRMVPLLDAHGLRKLLDQVELPLLELLTEVEMTGVLVDVHQLAQLGGRLEAQMQALEILAKDQAGRDFNVGSPRQLETILFDELKLPVIKRTKTGRSTDASVLEALADAHVLVATILELRQMAKLKSTYIDALPRLIHPQTGRIHTCFNQTVAATGRLSSSEPNLQNIPIRSELGRDIRRAFIAPEGHLLLSADYSQIELRVLAHLAQDAVLIDSFQRNEDVHTRTAMEVFAIDAASVTAEHRRQAKAINFGVIYGMGEVSLAKRLGIARGEAARFIGRYFERYQGVRKFMDETLAAAQQGEAVRTILGRLRHLPDLKSPNRQLRAQAERMAGNTPIQGSAADILKLAMVQLLHPPAPGVRMILTVHDELVFEVPENELEPAKGAIREAMENVMKLSVPLVVDIGVGRSWADAH